MMWNSSRSNLSRAGPGGIENLIMKGMLSMMPKTKTTIKNSNMLPMDWKDRSLSREGAQRMIKLILNGWSQNWQRGMISTSASDTAFKRQRRWHRSQSCFLVQMHASMNDASPEDSASWLHMRQMSFARGMNKRGGMPRCRKMTATRDCVMKGKCWREMGSERREAVPETNLQKDRDQCGCNRSFSYSALLAGVVGAGQKMGRRTWRRIGGCLGLTR
jgi:hypothetical protein